MIIFFCNWLIHCVLFYAVRAQYQPYNGDIIAYNTVLKVECLHHDNYERKKKIINDFFAQENNFSNVYVVSIRQNETGKQKIPANQFL